MCSMFPFRDSMGVLLVRCDQVRWLAEDGGGRRVGDIVHRMFETVDASLGTPFSRQQQHPDEPLLVTGHDRLVGFGGLDEITKLLRSKRAAAHRPALGRSCAMRPESDNRSAGPVRAFGRVNIARTRHIIRRRQTGGTHRSSPCRRRQWECHIRGRMILSPRRLLRRPW
jgi:hypothetical protein